jgi:hypothetical protein
MATDAEIVLACNTVFASEVISALPGTTNATVQPIPPTGLVEFRVNLLIPGENPSTWHLDVPLTSLRLAYESDHPLHPDPFAHVRFTRLLLWMADKAWYDMHQMTPSTSA